MWASRAIILFGLFFALILNLCPLFTWASRAILNSYACLFSSLKPPFTFAPPTVRLVVASLFALLFYSFAYLPLDYTGSPAGASLFCLLYLILFAFSLPIFYYKSCLFIIALNLFLDFIIDVLSLLGLSFDCPFFFFRPYNSVLKLSKVPKAPQSSHWYREFHIMVAEELRTSTSTKRFVTPKN